MPIACLLTLFSYNFSFFFNFLFLLSLEQIYDFSMTSPLRFCINLSVSHCLPKKGNNLTKFTGTKKEIFCNSAHSMTFPFFFHDRIQFSCLRGNPKNSRSNFQAHYVLYWAGKFVIWAGKLREPLAQRQAIEEKIVQPCPKAVESLINSQQSPHNIQTCSSPVDYQGAAAYRPPVLKEAL